MFVLFSAVMFLNISRRCVFFAQFAHVCDRMKIIYVTGSVRCHPCFDASFYYISVLELLLVIISAVLNVACVLIFLGSCVFKTYLHRIHSSCFAQFAHVCV